MNKALLEIIKYLVDKYKNEIIDNYTLQLIEGGIL